MSLTTTRSSLILGRNSTRKTSNTAGASRTPTVGASIGLSSISISTPLTSSSSAAILPTSYATTITSVPGFSTLLVPNTAWTTNTVTTSSSASGPTIIPVLVGCKSCGGKGHGILLFGLTKFFTGDDGGGKGGCLMFCSLLKLPTITFPGLPEFTFGQGGTPETVDDNEENISSSSYSTTPKSSTSTFTSIKSTASSSPSSARSTSINTTISSSTTAKSCSASSCSACSGYDWSYTAATPDPDDSAGRRRAVAGRMEYQLVERATQKVATTIASTCVVSAYTRAPAYPGARDVTSYESSGVATPASMNAWYATATQWYVPTQTGCSMPTITAVPAGALLGMGLGVSGPLLGGSPQQYVNIDHVYELKLLEAFFLSQTQRGVTCGDLTNIFDTQDTTQAFGWTRLNTIFDSLPSYANPDFIGMDYSANSVKGKLLSIGLINLDKPTQPGKQLALLARIGLVMGMCRDTKLKALFARTNLRIFEAFLGIDAVISSASQCGNPITSASKSGVAASPTWASAYSTWMTNYLAARGSEIRSTASILSRAIPTKGTATGTPYALYSTSMTEFAKTYTISDFSFDFGLTWPTTSPLAIARREDSPACTLSRSSSNEASSSVLTSMRPISTNTRNSTSNLTRATVTSHVITSILSTSNKTTFSIKSTSSNTKAPNTTSTSKSSSKSTSKPNTTISPTSGHEGSTVLPSQTAVASSATSILSCGLGFSSTGGTSTNVVKATSIPRSDTNQVLSQISAFCSPPEPITLAPDQGQSVDYGVDGSPNIAYQLLVIADPSPECARSPKIIIANSTVGAPDTQCNDKLSYIFNNCNPLTGDKQGGTLFVNCQVWGVLPFINATVASSTSIARVSTTAPLIATGSPHTCQTYKDCPPCANSAENSCDSGSKITTANPGYVVHDES
ncbi:MAG: hypothetical protein M1827_007166 [Pycnora praestabilis]|nr:MAG: hypothetical protein M1827_007166 [Pycnora praestabilis]